MHERGDGFVLRPDGIVSISDPVLTARVEATNSKAIHVGDSFVDLFKPRSRRARVLWSDARAVLIEQNRQLTNPPHVKALYHRMRALLVAHADRQQNLNWVISRAVAFALIPLIISGLSEVELKLLEDAQEVRLRTFLKSERVSPRRRLANFIGLRQATNAIASEARRRLNGQAPGREDFLQSLLVFADDLGVRRVAYLLTTLLAASSAAPEVTACCLVYAMHNYPEWRDTIEREMAALKPEELYSLPFEKLPSTLRFIKEAMRLWPFPFGVRRLAACDIDTDGLRLRKGKAYEMSLYSLHHHPDYWDDPESFDPDRWLLPRKSGTKGTYVPFGFASRSCVGSSVAQAQLLLICELFAHSLRADMAKAAAFRLRSDGIALPLDMTGTIRLATAT